MAADTSYKKLIGTGTWEVKFMLDNNIFHEVFSTYNNNAITDEIRRKTIINKIKTLIEEEKNRNKKTYEILLLYFYKLNDNTNKDYTLTEIGNIYKMSPQGVDQTLKRFYKRAKKILEKENL